MEKVKLSLALEKCSGCGICRLVCALANYKRNNPKIAHIKITGQFPDPGGYKISFKNCRFCGECIKWCPTGALTGAFPESIKKPPLAELMAKPTEEKKLGGYAGRILYVNLTKKKFTARPLPEKLAKEYIGGRGLAAYLLYQKTSRFFTLPFGPENRVVMASGPLSGVFVPAGGKITFASKSPLTKGYGDSNMGGHLAAELKYAGYDAIVIWGKAKKPSVLVVDDDRVELRDGSKYWGKFSMDAEKILKDDLGDDFQIAVIGPAGENLVHFACVSHDFGRQAGRTGIGAVLGSKNIKAICVRGSKDIPLFDTEAVFTKGKEMFKACLDDPGREIWQHLGTPGVTGWVNDSLGALPVKNFQTEALENCDSITGDRMRKEIVKYDKACGLCPMPCGKWSHAKKDGKYDVLVEGPEYETIALCGSNCGLTDIKDIAYANYLCDQYGIDTISAGGVIAFAMECFEKGILKKEMIGGREIKFGDIDSFAYLVGKIAEQDNVGKIFARGTRWLSEYLGQSSEKFAIQVKGLEWSGYGSRWAPAQMLAYITCDVGAHHNRCWVIGRDLELGRDTLEGKAEEVIYKQHARPMFDMLGVCRLQWVELKNFPITHYPEILKVVTGFDYTLEDLLQISERVWNLTRVFWVRENPEFGRKDDQPPARFLEEEVPNGVAEGKKMTQEQIDWLLDRYYELRDWDKNGIPTRQTLKKLGLGFVIKDIYP